MLQFHLTLTAFCPNSNPTTSDLSYKSVCTLSSATQCNCAVEDSFVPTECCTAEGKLERSEKCNGEYVQHGIISLAVCYCVQCCIHFARSSNGHCQY